jgi:hypothetical protein
LGASLLAEQDKADHRQHRYRNRQGKLLAHQTLPLQPLCWAEANCSIRHLGQARHAILQPCGRGPLAPIAAIDEPRSQI